MERCHVCGPGHLPSSWLSLATNTASNNTSAKTEDDSTHPWLQVPESSLYSGMNPRCRTHSRRLARRFDEWGWTSYMGRGQHWTLHTTYAVVIIRIFFLLTPYLAVVPTVTYPTQFGNSPQSPYAQRCPNHRLPQSMISEIIAQSSRAPIFIPKGYGRLPQRLAKGETVLCPQR